jgi:hypothetical protein
MRFCLMRMKVDRKIASTDATVPRIAKLGSHDAAAARRNLEAITLRPRIAFLLSALEGFETAEVATALDCTVEEAKALIEAAGEEIADQIRTDVLIIEDEPWIAVSLISLVEELDYRVVMSKRFLPDRRTPSRRFARHAGAVHRNRV